MSFAPQPRRTSAPTTTSSPTGTNVSREHLTRAEATARAEGVADRVSFRHGNAMALDFPDESFDAAMSIDVGTCLHPPPPRLLPLPPPQIPPRAHQRRRLHRSAHGVNSSTAWPPLGIPARREPIGTGWNDVAPISGTAGGHRLRRQHRAPLPRVRLGNHRARYGIRSRPLLASGAVAEAIHVVRSTMMNTCWIRSAEVGYPPRFAIILGIGRLPGGRS